MTAGAIAAYNSLTLHENCLAMIVIPEADIGTRVWSDPLVDVHVVEFCDRAINRHEEDESFVDLANHLCDMSRDLIYRVNRVTVSQVKLMICVFELSVGILEEAQIDNFGDEEKTKRYVAHIAKRVEMLKKQLP